MSDQSTPPYYVIAFYHFCPIPDPQAEIAFQRNFFEGRDIASRIYISENGINGQMSASRADTDAYIHWMHSRNEFKDVHFKLHPAHEHAFPRRTVKYRRQLVAVDEVVNLDKRGCHLSPEKWQEMLETKKDYVLLDVRNDYEWKVGHFDKAELPPCETFRDFKQYVQNLKGKVDPENTPVMMYCTGGIRCELYSSILIEKGFTQVYQLEGGIINYGLKQGSKHWLGKLFVFDDRLTVPISEEETKVIGVCHHCQKPNETYVNCANMDCNALFLCCQDCLKKNLGCCKDDCKTAERLRPYHHETAHKPFRKWYHYPSIKKNKK